MMTTMMMLTMSILLAAIPKTLQVQEPIVCVGHPREN